MPDERTEDAEETAERETITVAEKQSGTSGTSDTRPTITIAERESTDK